MSPHGGRRKGAGRKPRLENSQTVAVVLDGPLLERIDNERGETSRSEYIRQKLREAMERND